MKGPVSRHKVLRKARALAWEIGMTDEERHEIAEFVFWSKTGSWNDLTTEELVELTTMLEGYVLITFLSTVRSPK